MMKKLMSTMLCIAVLLCTAVPVAAADPALTVTAADPALTVTAADPALTVTAADPALTIAADPVQPSSAAENSSPPSGFSNFTAVRDYTEGQFTDVRATDWFSSYVASAYRMNLMSGVSATMFNAAGNVTMAETITVAAKLHSIYHTGSASGFPSTTPWYKAFVDYARENNIYSVNLADYNRPASRAEYVTILAKAFPDEAFPVISDVDDNAIPDVPMTRSYAEPVYTLYRAGILAGSDEKGTFKPDSNIRRSEVATILIKMVDPSQRRETTFRNTSGMNAVSVAALCSPAVFYIEVCDARGFSLSSGSGFFIDQEGYAITNYHVIEGAYGARIKLSDGTVCNVAHVCDYDEANDVALLKIEGSGYSALTMNTEPLVSGQTVFAIGSPYGLDNSISQGIVANPKRTLDGIDYIQFTASVSSGNSGGALLNEHGEVIGITTMAFVDTATTSAQNLNMALPITLARGLNRSGCHAFPVGVGGSTSSSDMTGEIFVGNAGKLVVPQDSLVVVPVYFEANTPVSVFFDDGYSMDRVLCTWGDFEDQYIPLYVCGMTPGRSEITVYLYNDDATVMLDYVDIKFDVRPVEFQLSQTSVTVKNGESALININCNYHDFTYADYSIETDVFNTSVAECQVAAKWTDADNIKMTITGLSPGFTEVDVFIYDGYNFIFGETLTVKVVR